MTVLFVYSVCICFVGVFLNCWRLVKYLSGAAQACTHWLFVDSLGKYSLYKSDTSLHLYILFPSL